jgi:glycosyltransferase involved in cell wall biosynthesis
MNLVVDISHILKWQGRLTGVERVEFNIINFYLKQGARFAYWHDQSNSWVEVDALFVEDRIINRATLTQPNVKPSIISRVQRKLKVQQSKHIEGKKIVLRGNHILIPAGLWDNEAYIQSLEDMAKDNSLLHVIHDMIPILYPGFVVDYLPKVFGKYMYRVLPICTELLANSDNTKKDTIRVLNEAGLSVPNIDVFRLGDDIETQGDDRRPTHVPSKFLLCVGTIEARKNHQIFNYLYRLALEKDVDIPNIVLAGSRGWHTDNFLQMVETDPYLKQKIIIMDNVDDKKLRWLYQNATMTIFPSFYEGWGLPVAESLAYNRVTLSSSTSSMPEVGGESADYFSPNSPEELLQLIRLYLDSHKREKREQYIKSHFKLTPWAEALNHLDKILRNIIRE